MKKQFWFSSIRLVAMLALRAAKISVNDARSGSGPDDPTDPTTPGTTTAGSDKSFDHDDIPGQYRRRLPMVARPDGRSARTSGADPHP